MISVRALSKPVHAAVIVAVALALGACGGRKNEARLLGERISVLSFERALETDPNLASVRVSLPQPYRNMNWPQPGGSTENVMHHLWLDDQLDIAWRTSIGRGSKSYERLVSGPVVANGVVYTIDIRAEVSAIDASSGRAIWRVQLKDPEERSKVAFGGGVSYFGGRLYVTTGYGFVAALDATNGSELWRHAFKIPIRGGPTIANGRVYTITQDNQLFALDADTGDQLWDYVGIVENAGILGAASPAVSGDTVVAAFSSGELLALRTQNGQVAWQDALGLTGRLTALATLNDIDGQPVIDRGRVYAINHAGRMVAIDFRTGERVWESNVGSINTPWVAGNYIFVVTIDNEVAALSLRDGRVRWVTQLQRFKDQEDRKGVIRWSGPLLAGDRLIVVSSHGYILTLSPYTGDILSGERLSGETVIEPVIADGTLYVLTDDGDLIAYR